jgi:DNA-binding NtrC family response regulator
MTTDVTELEQAETEQDHQKHILVVDDETLFLHSLEFFLTRARFDVTLKSSARDALELLKEDHHRFDLLILDILIPEFSGLDLIDALIDLKIPIPIIVITGYASREIESKLEQCNIKGYLNKPFPYKELLVMVESVFADNTESGEDSHDRP